MHRGLAMSAKRATRTARMDLRTKLILAFVAVALLSMALLGSFAYQTSAGLLMQSSQRQLDALAESKQDDLEQLVEGWRDRVRLIRSRTQLRLSLAEHLDDAGHAGAEASDEAPLARIERILADALDSTSMVRRIVLFDPQRRPLVSVGHADVEPLAPAVTDPEQVAYAGVAAADGSTTEIAFHAQLDLEGRHLGFVEVVFDARELGRVTRDYTGLGETGETLVVIERRPGELLVPSALRHDPDPGHQRPERATTAMRAALDGVEQVFPGTAIDYRGTEVWAATRSLSELGWGLVVKIDVEEESRRVDELGERLLDVGLALSAFAILGGVLLGITLARPLHELAELVHRVRHGETHLRANADGDDEVAYLARKLNELMDELEKQRTKPE